MKYTRYFNVHNHNGGWGGERTQGKGSTRKDEEHQSPCQLGTRYFDDTSLDRRGRTKQRKDSRQTLYCN